MPVQVDFDATKGRLVFSRGAEELPYPPRSTDTLDDAVTDLSNDAFPRTSADHSAIEEEWAGDDGIRYSPAQWAAWEETAGGNWSGSVVRSCEEPR
jgi:hypothetical protein